MKRKFSFRMHAKGKRRKKGDTSELAAQLAPLEELDKRMAARQVGGVIDSANSQAGRDYGAIIVDNDNLNLPKDMMEGRSEKRILGMEPVVIVILSIMLGFIAFIAWQISLMPPE